MGSDEDFVLESWKEKTGELNLRKSGERFEVRL